MPHRGQNFRGGRQRGRGRGRGVNHGGGRGRGQDTSFMDDFDSPVQFRPNNNNGDGTPNHGRGRGSPFSPQNSRATTPRGAGTPRGRGRGNHTNDQFRSPGGRRGSKLRSDAPLSKLLYEERPLLKPIIFVPSVHTRTLFEQSEELLQPQVEDVADEETSHVPTADRVARVFSGNVTRQEDSSSSDDDPDESYKLEEIDFEDMARIREEVDSAAASTALAADVPASVIMKTAEEKFTGVVVKTNPSTMAPPTVQDEEIASLANEMVIEETSFCINTTPSLGLSLGSPSTEQTGFFIDTKPSTSTSKMDTILVERVDPDTLLGEDDDIIVYVAPHPRLNKSLPAAEETVSSLPSTSILTGTSLISTAHQSVDTPSTPAPAFDSVSFSFANSPTPRKQPRTRPAFTVGERIKIKAKARKKEVRAARRRLERQAMFGQFGAIMSEAQLRVDEKQPGKGRDPRWEERRRGDSDVDWGDSDCIEPETVGCDEVLNGLGAMELDSELDIEAMKTFVKGMSANGGRHVTMDDLADEERMREEDAQGTPKRGDESGGEREEDANDEEDMMDEEKAMMIQEHRDVSFSISDDDDSSDGIDQSPNAGFQARLKRVRERARGKKVVNAEPSSDEDISDDEFFNGVTRGEEDEDFIAQMTMSPPLDGKKAILGSKQRKSHDVFRAIRDGDFSELENIVPVGRKKDKHVPAFLQNQWDKDRAKKAEFKKAREQARLEAAADPLLPKKGGQKSRKATLAAAKLDPSISIPERIVDFASLEQQIRRFLDDIGGQQTMVLPPMEKESRKQVHELAAAFNLKSQSKGKGKGRYTTLMKTTKSGTGINVQKVKKIMKRSEGGFVDRGGGKGKGLVPRHKDGDEVGKAAPKIGDTNIGFKMLASMGWSEGDRIGISGGLDAPLTVVIKNTKLGLGANR